MIRFSVVILVLSIVLASNVIAEHPDKVLPQPPIPVIHHDRHLDNQPSPETYRPARVQAAIDTFVLGDFTFDGLNGPDPQGWTGVERYSWGAVADTYFHVADTTELTGGFLGRLIVLEGDHSLWCGALPAAAGDVCYYATLPGYGNNWAQLFTSVSFPHDGDVEISFLCIWDSEPGEDFTYLEFINKDDDWEQLANYSWMLDGTPQLESFVIPGSSLGDSVQIRFRFRSDGGWSDEDGYWDTDGAIVIDSLTVSDAGGLINFQDFESEPVGARVTGDGFWSAGTPNTRGNFSGLFSSQAVLQEDGCVESVSGLWGFFNGSTDNYACGGHPEQLAVPQGLTRSYLTTDYLSNEIWSPFMDWAEDVNGTPIPATAGRTILEFDVYRDLPIDYLVFYDWSIRSLVGGCALDWKHNSDLYYGRNKDWYRHRTLLTGMTDPGVEKIQVSLKVMDMCANYCGIYGDGSCHSQAPLFDNVRIIRVNQAGPAWDEFAYDLFQDNFATDSTLTGTVRMDASFTSSSGEARDAVSMLIFSDIGIDLHVPGDPSKKSAVYCHVKDVSPAKSGAVVSDDLSRSPLVTTGGGWTVLQCYDSYYRPQGGFFSIDLNDDLYQPGDTVWYYFSARDLDGVTSYWSVHTGTVLSEAEVLANPMEVTCLPANALSGTTDVLYVDGFDGYSAQPYFDTAFEMLGLTPDRYDIVTVYQAETGPGSRIKDVVQQLAPVYKTIIWNTGYFKQAGIHDGTIVDFNQPTPDDFGMLFEFLDQSPNRPGVYLTGDNLASWWLTRTGDGAVNMRDTYLNFNVVNGNHSETGEAVSPLVIGLPGSCFDPGAGGLDMLIAYAGGCTGVNEFDVFQPYGTAQAAMVYEGDQSNAAIVTQISPNSAGDVARVMLSGFSFHNIRDSEPGSLPARVVHLEAILDWFESDPGDPVGGIGRVSPVNILAQNYPNPFNPSTTIHYSIKVPGRVTLKIYTPAGELIKTLVDEQQRPKAGGYSVSWDGRNRQGSPVSSGVYFYSLTAKNFSLTKKMVLLK